MMSAPEPTSIATSTLRIMGMDLTVHVLDTGQRVIDAEDFRRFVAAMGGPTPLTEDEAVALAKVIRGPHDPC